MNRRYEADINAISKAINAATLLHASVRKALRAQLAQAAAELRNGEPPRDWGTFRAVLPYNPLHAKVFLTQAATWKALGLGNLTCGVPNVWDPTELVATPSTGGQIDIHTMRGEYRAAAINLANASSEPIKASVRFEGLPDVQKYVTVHEVPWTDTAESRPVLAALPLAKRDGDAWRVTVLPGLVRQVWCTFHVETLPPGDYTGRLVVESPQNKPLFTAVHLKVYPLDFPKQTTLLLGGFSYTDQLDNARGVTPQNHAAFVAHLKEHFVNAPWATKGVMLPCEFSPHGAAQINTRIMDEWLAQWPNAKMYLVYLSLENTRSFWRARRSAQPTSIAA